LWQTPSSDKPPTIVQTNKLENNDVLVTIVSAVLISRGIMAMLLVSMLKYQQEMLLFVSVIKGQSDAIDHIASEEKCYGYC
jgi:hypothetical protein